MDDLVNCQAGMPDSGAAGHRRELGNRGFSILDLLGSHNDRSTKRQRAL